MINKLNNQSGQARLQMPERSDGGQALLIVVLLATVLVTIGLSLSRVATEEQQISKLEEEAKKATYAAEAGLEAALRQSSGTVNIGSLGLGQNITGTATIQSNQTTAFTSPLVKKDEQYTFYLSAYDPATKTITGSAYGGSLTVNRVTPAGTYCASSSTQFALEMTFINTQTKTYAGRRLIDECGLIAGTNDEILFGGVIDLATFPSHLLFLRVIAPDNAFSGTTFSITRNDGANWPLQGKTIVSEAKTTSGPARKIQLFQSYPQLPSEMFVTSF